MKSLLRYKKFFQFPYIKIFKNILNKNFNIKFLTVLELEKTRTIFKGFLFKRYYYIEN